MQVVGYSTGLDAGESDPKPGAILIADDGVVDREPLVPGRDLAYSLGDRHCAGTIEAGTHIPCDNPTAPYCADHASTWVCARCTGNCLKPEPTCEEEHVVYLAAFAPATFKVGVTRRHRFHTRLREQGADRGARIYTVADGRIARQIEAELAADIPDRVRVQTKIDGMHRAVDEAAWADLLSAFDVQETITLDYGLSLTDRPLAETIATGTVRGQKGRIILLERAGRLFAVDLRDLVGHELAAGASSRDVQSSLGTFE